MPLVGKVRLKVTTRPWMMRVMRHFKFVRALPTWHRKEKDFREWYVGLLDRIDLGSEAGYRNAVKVLEMPGEAPSGR